MSIEARLKELNITLPQAAAPAANYVPYVVDGNTVYISGQLPMGVGNLEQHIGKLGSEFTIEQGKHIARICAMNILSQLRAACGGDLDKVERCLRVGGFVQSAEGFVDQPAVVNGASDFLVEVLGDKGKHARAAVGVNQLPKGVAVEVDAIFRIKA